MPGRKFAAGNGYRYGFNGKENDNEVRGDANALDFGERSIYDPRLGRFISVDPNYRQLPDFSPYQYARNNPIMLKENGKDGIIPKWLWRTGLIDPVAAGFIDAIADDVKGLVNVAEVITAFNPTQLYFYTPSASQVRNETWQMTKTALDVMSNPVLQGIVAAQAFEKISNTVKNADFRDYQYATGYAGWQVLTALVGVGEAKALLQGGKASVEVLKLISGFGKVEKGLEILEGGVKIERKLAGFADKVAVIGRDFNTNVKTAAKALEKKTGKSVELFNASEGALTEWSGLLKKYNGAVPEDIAKGSKIYKENLEWAQKLKKEGYTVYDAGLGTQGEKGTFYGMETKEVFGDKK